MLLIRNMERLFWVVIQFLMTIDASLAESEDARWLDNFTHVPNRFIDGYDLFNKTMQIPLVFPPDTYALKAACEAECLSELRCKSFEIVLANNECYVSDKTMYDVGLNTSSDYDFFNRVYDCGRPPSQACNVSADYTDTLDGSIVTYSCDKDLVSRHLPRNVSCTSNGWGIEENVLSCSGYTSNFTLIPETYSEGQYIIKFDIDGDPMDYQRKCEATCLAEPRCKSYEIRDDGRCYINDYDMNAFSLVKYEHTDMYNRHYDCGCPPVQLSNVLSSYNDSHVGSVLEYSCGVGTRNPHLPMELTCTSSGWGVAANNFSCTVACGAPPIVNFATVTDYHFFLPGHRVTYSCIPGYVILGEDTSCRSILCLEDGTWEQEPTCTNVSEACAQPPNVTNAFKTEMTVYTVGANVTYTCEAGHVIANTTSNIATISCKPDLRWEQEPTCTKNCGRPPSVSHSTNSGVAGTVFVPNDEVTYTCDANYVIKGTIHNHTTIKCQTSGTWDDVPVCAVNCGPPPVVPHATKTSGNVFTPGQTITYICDHQYIIPELKVNTTHVTCKEDGTWDQTPICEVNCEAPTGISYGSVSAGSIFTPGEEVTYTCDENYVIMGIKLSKVKSECQANGMWSVLPNCTRNCGPPPSVPHCSHNGVRDVFVKDEQVTYTCDSNYVMKGTVLKNATTKCQASGMWQDTPICSVNCGTPDVVQHASRTPTGSIFTPGDIVTWTCKDRYVMRETNLQKAQTICQDNGTWTLKPHCIAYCGEHPDVVHAIVNGTGAQEGDKRNFECVTGHAMAGQPEITCLSSSQWETPPTCPADCGEAPSLRSGRLLGAGNLENNTRNITCNDGYVLVGAAYIKCLPTGQWETLPECQAAAVHAFQQNMFGADKSPISSQTSIAMIFAILFFICLVAVAVAHIYMLVKKRRNRNKRGEKKSPPSSNNDRMSTNSFDFGHKNAVFYTITPDAWYDRPIPRGLQGDRSWRELWY